MILIDLTLSRRRPLSYRNQQSKSMDWFQYDNGLRHERVKEKRKLLLPVQHCSNVGFLKLDLVLDPSLQ